jgi:predicted dehydrogenase
MIRLGLIGVGPWGQRYIERVRVRSDARIAALARGSSAAFEGISGVESCASWTALVRAAAEGALDGVIAATHPEHQAEVAIACAEAGVPLLVEKPLGLSAAAANAARRAFDGSARKAPLVVDYVHLWSLAFRCLQQQLERSGGPAQIAAIESVGWNRGPFRTFSPIYDYGSHDIAMLLRLLGVGARLGRVVRDRVDTQDPRGELHQFHLELEGVPVELRLGNGASTKRRLLRVALRDGRDIIYDDTLAHPLKLMAAGKSIPVDERGPLDIVLDEFLQEIGLWRCGQAATIEHLVLSERVNEILERLISTPFGAA